MQARGVPFVLPDPDEPEGAALIRRLAEEHGLDELVPARTAWSVARAIEERCAEEFGMVDQTITGMTSTNFGRFVFYPIPAADRARRRERVATGFRESAVERARWLRERRPPGGVPSGLTLYLCSEAPFAAVRTSSEHGFSDLRAVVEEEVAAGGWRILDESLLAKRIPADISFESLLASPPYRVFDVLFWAMD